MKKVILTLIFCMTTIILFAPPLPGGRPDAPAAEETAPLSTSSFLLLGLAAGYTVIKKKREKNK
ncbi:MAG: hypothetical protein LBR28_02960 [Bacteroidales bacterium]|jgi:hypothetical protein|nr:hypothetical protein [Bacteroidales bacterium]